MKNAPLLKRLLESETEEEVLSVLTHEDLLAADNRWKYLGGMPNNQSIVHNQQSTASAALVEKFTNGLDAILLKHCKLAGIDPRSSSAPQSMSGAVDKYFGDISANPNIRGLAEENLVLYATGTKERPSLSLYDAGEGQLAEDFPTTFCSLIYASQEGSYKGAIPFVQGRFNMGGTGVLPFCSDVHKLQLIVSRVPPTLAGGDSHEWAYTLFCFFPSKQNPSWKYLVGADGNVMTGGVEPLGLVPKLNAKSGAICLPRERSVSGGTLIKMYDYKAPRSNICGEQFKKLQEYLLRPTFPLRIIECRKEYLAKVMGVTIWDRFGGWSKGNKMEEGFEDGASVSILLETGETIPAEIRVFKSKEKSGEDEDSVQTGLRAMINGQSHAKRDASFFRTKAVDKEHIAGSMLVTLDCTSLGQSSRNAIFMTNRETFRDDPLLQDLLSKLQAVLKGHEGLESLNNKRYEEKIKNAVDDATGISALEELLASDPTLADLFGGVATGKVAAKTASNGNGGKMKGEAAPFKGKDFPTFFSRSDGSTEVGIEVPVGAQGRVSFLTDVKSNYFSRQKHRGTCTFVGDFEPTPYLFDGRLTLRYLVDKKAAVGSVLSTEATITDNKESGPFKLKIVFTVTQESAPKEPKKKKKKADPKTQTGPSRPDIKEVDNGPEALPLTIEKNPITGRLQLFLNTGSQLLLDARDSRTPEEVPAVDFVFKYGLALTAMGLLDAAKETEEWKQDEASCKDRIQESARGVGRVIVPLCLTLPNKLPKKGK